MTEDRRFPDFEAKWQQRWAETPRKPAADTAPKAGNDFYVLSMFPYPSGRLHFGHALPYTLTDSIARYKRMCGCNVLNPMGWDAFGLPAENAAIEAVRRGEKNVHPARTTDASIAAMREQMHAFGYSFDWDRELHTCRPDYYKWTQWIFLQMHKRGVAYRRKSRVNWCNDCKTTLANEQVETHVKDGEEFQACFRCGTRVEPREIDAWFLRITDYADRLLQGLDALQPNWPELVTSQQRNWIGRSEGVNIDFEIELRPGASGSGPLKPPGAADAAAPAERERLTVFTTRADTVFGVTFVAIAPEHPLVARILKLVDARTHKRIADFVTEALSMTEQDRASGDEKEGVATGMFAVNPLSGEKVPVFIANYVLMYGTGAVMAVPAHDQRDHDFAREARLPRKQVIAPADDAAADINAEAFTEPGVLIDSGKYTGMASADAIAAISADLKQSGRGGPVVNYKLRDWGISRQRYWGCPIPMVHCPDCGIVPVPEDQLPVRLPDDVDFLPTGQSPLTLHPDFQRTPCPACGRADARRDTDTMDTFVDSSWYFLRYTDPRNENAIFDPARCARWTPVDLYVGGREHAILHLIYARFFTKFLHDIGLIQFEEPFSRLYAHGLVQGESRRVVTDEIDRYVTEDELNALFKAGRAQPEQVVRRIEKMSKSKRNGADPTALVAQYGADAVRLTILFMGPAEADSVWDSDSIKGPYNFLRRWHDLALAAAPLIEDLPELAEPLDAPARALRHSAHSLIAKAAGEFEGRFSLNTVIARGMELVNELRAFVNAHEKPTTAQRHALREALDTLCLVMAPLAPHTAEELHEALGGQGSVFERRWPVADPAALQLDEIELPVQVNGKVRGTIRFPREADKAEMERLALANDNVRRFVDGKSITKLIVVPGRIVNVVAK